MRWTPNSADSYTGYLGGGKPGPSQKMIAVARKSISLANIFLVIIPMSFFHRVAETTNKYCYQDWVVEKERNDRDGNKMKTKYYQDCSDKIDGHPTPGRRHRADNEVKKYEVTAGFVLCSLLVCYTNTQWCTFWRHEARFKEAVEACTRRNKLTLCEKHDDSRCI